MGTTSIIKSIEFGNRVYTCLRNIPGALLIMRHEMATKKNLIINTCQTIRLPEGEYHIREFTQYKKEVRRTWDIQKMS